MATVYRSRKGLSFELSGVFVPIYEVNEKNHAASCAAQPELVRQVGSTEASVVPLGDSLNSFV